MPRKRDCQTAPNAHYVTMEQMFLRAEAVLTLKPAAFRASTCTGSRRGFTRLEATLRVMRSPAAGGMG